MSQGWEILAKAYTSLSLYIILFWCQKLLVFGPIALHLQAQNLHGQPKHLGAHFQRLKSSYFGPEPAGLLLYKGKSLFLSL